MAQTQLNLARFLKVVRLAHRVPHTDSAAAQKERDAAWGLAERMADEAGLSLDDALSKIDSEGEGPFFRPEPPPPEHPWEQALREALDGHNVKGWARSGAELPPKTLQAVRGAIPWPRTMREAIAEVTTWDELELERIELPGYLLGDGPQLRVHLLRQYLQGVAQTPEDMVARARWLAESRSLLFEDPSDSMKLVADDLARMFEMLRAPRVAQDGQAQAPQAEKTTTAPAARETNRQKRERLRAILSEPGADTLSTREVARRAGVSVQGAANYRKAMAEGRV